MRTRPLCSIFTFAVLSCAVACAPPTAPPSLKTLRDALAESQPPSSGRISTAHDAAGLHLLAAEERLKEKDIERAEDLAMLGLISLRIDEYERESERQRVSLEELNLEESAARLSQEQLEASIASLEVVAARAALLARVEGAVAEALKQATLLDEKKDAELNAADLALLEKARLTVAREMLAAAVSEKERLKDTSPTVTETPDYRCLANAIASAQQALLKKDTARVQQDLETGFVCLRRLSSPTIPASPRESGE